MARPSCADAACFCRFGRNERCSTLTPIVEFATNAWPARLGPSRFCVRAFCPNHAHTIQYRKSYTNFSPLSPHPLLIPSLTCKVPRPFGRSVLHSTLIRSTSASETLCVTGHVPPQLKGSTTPTPGWRDSFFVCVCGVLEAGGSLTPQQESEPASRPPR
jgi:hypothetical protein